MCDPLTLGSLAIGAAGTAANSIGQASAAKKQESAYNAWAANQKTIRANENLRQEDLRKKAEVSQQQGVQDISAANQTAEQTAEQARLADLYAGGAGNAATATPVSVADAGLSGDAGGGEVFQTDLARKLSDAAASAKSRLGALATLNSYGGSWGGLGTVNPIAQQTAGSGIDAANEARRGSMAAYGVERAVEPLQYSDGTSPLATDASAFLGVGMNKLGAAAADGTVGSGLSGLFKNKVKTPLKLAASAPYTGLF